MDIGNLAFRRRIIDEIESDENKQRKAEHLKRFRVYNDHQREYVLQALAQEFSPQTVREMRTFTSINLTRRIIDEMSSIYKRSPERNYLNLTEPQESGVSLIYQDAKVDTMLKRANQKFKLHEQCAIQVLPKNGKLCLKLLAPHQYDVISMPNDSEEAWAYVISSYDKYQADAQTTGQTDVQGNYTGSKNQAKADGVNQAIADQDDWRTDRRYVVWTAEKNILMDGNGAVLQEATNEIGKLPFIDVADEKDFEYWVRRGSGAVEFNLDFLTVVSDTCNTNRLQSYAQAVITAERLPESTVVGPQHILFLPLDPTRPEVKPSFEFVTPNADLKASLDLNDRLLSYFLTANGISPKTISGDATTEKFSSGVERLLSMIDRFEASQSDIALFQTVEWKLYDLLRSWYQVTAGTTALEEKYNFGAWPEDSELMVTFKGPEAVKTQSETEDSVIKRLDAGLITKTEAVAELRGIDLEAAKVIADQLDPVNNMEA